MANTYTCLHYHIIFSTKNRQRWISPDIEERLWSYLGGIADRNGMTPLKNGGIEDHVHIVVGLTPTMAPSKAVQLPKGGSSLWIHETFPELAEFAWQDGYGAFTVSKSQLPDLIEYVKNQREHHRTRTFQEEYRAFLEKHGIEYDERYLWGWSAGLRGTMRSTRSARRAVQLSLRDMASSVESLPALKGRPTLRSR